MKRSRSLAVRLVAARLAGAGTGALLVLLVLAGCGADKEAAFSAMAPEAEKSRLRDQMSPKRAGGAPAEALAEEPVEGDAVLAAASGFPPLQPEERKRIYSGFCRLVVDRVEEKQRELARFAEENGGYVESSYDQTIVLRVPAGRFAELFEQVLDMGELAYRSVETLDVSDYFRDQEARLTVACSARQRLYALLERTEDVEERLAILREIKRLSEEIERIRLTLELLERQIAFSRITVELIPRLRVGEAGRADIPFEWIAALDPVYGSVSGLKGRVTLTLGEDFAVLAERGGFRAESPEGTRVRVGSLDNRPRGDDAFWQKALVHHLGPYYRTVEALQAGSFRGVLFTSKDREPYSYLVAVLVRKGRLYVLEVFFPDASARERRLGQVLQAAAELEVRQWLP